MNNSEMLEKKLEEKRGLLLQMHLLEGSEKREAEKRFFQLRKEISQLDAGVFSPLAEINSIKSRYKQGQQMSSDDMRQVALLNQKISDIQAAANKARCSLGLFIKK